MIRGTREQSATRHQTVVAMLDKGHTVAEIMAETTYCASNIRHIRLRHRGVFRPAAEERFEMFEAALTVGLTVTAALDDAGWSNAEAAARAYWRADRKMPDALRTTANRQAVARKARREASA